MMRPIRTPMVPSRNHTVGSWRKTSALISMEKPMMPPTNELKAAVIEKVVVIEIYIIVFHKKNMPYISFKIYLHIS